MSGPILCVGTAVLDRIYGVDHLPSRDGKMLARSLHVSGGGMAANGAVAIVRLGGRAAWCGRVGDEAIGAAILSGLKSEGVDTGWARVVAGEFSPHSIVLCDQDGNRSLIVHRSETMDPSTEWIAQRDITPFAAVHSDTRWPEGSKYLLSAARDRGIPGVLDVDSANDGYDVKPIVALASHTIFSTVGLREMFAIDDLELGLVKASALCRFVAVTMGADGVMWRDKSGSIIRLPAFKVNALETIGAGDIFHGGFALALVEGLSEREALLFASAAAAVKCSRVGGRQGYPLRSDVTALLK